MDENSARVIAEQIARGHAYTKHVVERDDFPEIKSREEFAELIGGIMIDPLSITKQLRDGRQAFWNELSGTVVILDLMAEDGGTAYRPDCGRDHFRLLR
jgi:hypothetical protein